MGEVSTLAVATAVTVIALVWKWSKRSNSPDRTEIPRGVLKAGILQTPGDISLPCTSTYEMLEVGKKASNNGPFLRDSNENWITYQDCIDQTLRIAAGLHALGVDQPGTKIGIFAPNCIEWVLFEFACYRQSLVPVALYDTLGADAVELILEETECPVVLCGEKQSQKVLELQQLNKLSFLKHVILIDTKNKNEKELSKNVTLFSELISPSHSPVAANLPANGEVLATISYTSGTSGRPKGVMLSHTNLICNAMMSKERLNVPRLEPGPSSMHLSYLPLSHMLERTVVLVLMSLGARIAFNADKTKLFDDLQAVKPTQFLGVPRVFNRVYKKILFDVESKSFLARTIFHWALRYKLALGVERHWLLDKIVFSKICAKLGGNVKIVISGAAPLDPEVLRFLRCVFCCPSVEGYGQTEATAGIAIQSPEDPSLGHVGPPLVGVEVKLQDVPEANINAARDGRGELLVRGPNVFQGYFKNETKTRETVEDKWLKTGDVAEFTSDGQIRIVDRAKAIFKLSQGEYVAPDHLEGVYALAASVGQIFVDGRSSEDTLVAIVVPAEGVETTREQVLEELQTLCKEKKLKGFERIHNVRLVQEEFTEDNGILTSTSKLKRAVARERFSTLIDEMYEELHQK